MFNMPPLPPAVVMMPNPVADIQRALFDLSSPDPNRRLQSIGFFITIASRSDYAQIITSQNGIGILVHALSDYIKNVRFGALMVLSDLSEYKITLPYMVNAGAIPILENFNSEVTKAASEWERGASKVASILILELRQLSAHQAPERGTATVPLISPPVENKEIQPRPAASSIPFEGNQISDRELSLGRKLGQGGFGVVYEARWQGHTTVALKQLLNQHLREDALIEFKREADMHAKLRHPNIVILYGLCVEPMKYAMVMEYMSKGSLYHALRNERFSWSLKLKLACGIVSGLRYLHHNNIIHRDLKSLNVLVDEKSNAKLSDFGLSKVKTNTESMTKGQMGTVRWMAPELFEVGGSCSKRSDIYALGIIFWEIVTEQLPYKKLATDIQVVKYVSGGGRESVPEAHPGYAALITDCWKQRSVGRPTAEEVASVLHNLN